VGKPLYSREFHLWHRRLTRALATSIFTPFQPASAKHFGVQSTSHFSDLTPGGLTLALYNEKVIDHYQNPRNVGEIESADALGVAENSACGDILHLYLKIDGDRIVRASFKSFGCAAAIAAGSVLTEMVTDRTLEEMKAITKQAVDDALGGLSPMKVHCSVLAEDAVRAALDDYRSRNPLHPTAINTI